MSIKKLILMFIALIVCACTVAAQNQTQGQPEKTIKHVPIKSTSPVSGKEMYMAYCAVCHGTDGKGNGPAASAMKIPPTDLTTLAQKNGGKFPAAHVAAVIRGEALTPSHGSHDMPIWRPLFSSISHGHESEVQQRTTNLFTFIETLQAK